jgi:hypothetical protein
VSEHARFEATVHAEPGRPGPETAARIAALDLDRIPDPDGIRLLVSMDEAARLVDQGFEVRLLRAAPQVTGPATTRPATTRPATARPATARPATEHRRQPDTEPDGFRGEEYDDRWDHGLWDYEVGGEG